MDVTPQTAAALGILLSFFLSASLLPFPNVLLEKRKKADVNFQKYRREAFWKACFLETLNARKGKR